MRAFLSKCKMFFVYAGVFSLCLNVLMLASPIYIMQLFDRVFGSRSNETLLVLTLMALVAMVVMSLLEMVRSQLLVRIGAALDRILSPQVLEEVLRAAVRPSGESNPFALRDVNTLRTFVTGQGIKAFFDAPWAPIFVAIIFFFHPVLGGVALLGIGALFGLAILEEKVTRELVTESKNKSRRTSAFTDMSQRNAEVVYALGMISSVTARWQALNDEALGPQTRANHRSAQVLAASRFARMAIQVAMLAVAAYLVIDQHITPGVTIASTLILGRALAPVEMAIAGWKAMIEARGAYDRLTKTLEASEARATPMLLPAPEGRLSLDRVTFARNIANPILKGITFELEPGTSLGIIGPSAAGKSTLARVIMGIWKPFSGAVRLDGASISDWDHDQLTQYVGYLPQDVELFSATVAENIARLRDPAECTEEIIAAAKRAGVHDMILHLPEGYDTQIGSGIAVLSGGQRQRIALARALFGNPRLIVLDEPNSNLDSEGEAALMEAMQRMKEQGATLIVITHRPSILTGIDKILMLREGRAELFGPRQEVMARLARTGVVPLAQPPRPQAIG